jgi:hypothetical protein
MMPMKVMVMLLAGLAMAPARADLTTIDDFSGLVLWAGSGTNSAAFVLQFSGTQPPASIAWGYRWSGTSTMQAMADAIAGTTSLVNGAPVPPGLDSRLTIAGTQYSFGVFLSAITYDQVGLPAGWSQATRLIADTWFLDGTYPVLYTKADAAGVWLGEGETETMTFAYSLVGASDIELTPGGWYGFVQSNGAEAFPFAKPVAAVPEPSGAMLLGCGAATATALARQRRRRQV